MTDPQTAPRRAEQPPTGAFPDAWLLLACTVTILVYVVLIVIKPTGENWGRGWNLIAYFIYSAPAALIAAGIALWRRLRMHAHASGRARTFTTAVMIASCLYPLIALVVIKAKA